MLFFYNTILEMIILLHLGMLRFYIRQYIYNTNFTIYKVYNNLFDDHRKLIDIKCLGINRSGGWCL